MHFLLSFTFLSCSAFASVLAAPYPPTPNIPLHSLYHYCSPPAVISTSRSAVLGASAGFCNAAATTYHPNLYGEVEVQQEDGLYLRAWWDASTAEKETFEFECTEAIARILRGCQREGQEEGKFYGGVSELAHMSGKVEMGFD